MPGINQTTTRVGGRAYLVVVLALIALTSVGCDAVQSVLANNQAPTARIKSVSLQGLTLEQAQLEFDVEVENHYGFDLPLLDLDYSLASEGKAFLAGRSQLSGSVPATGSRTIKLPATVSFSDLIAAVKNVRPGAVVPYRANMSLMAKSPAVGTISLPMSKSGEVPVPAPPTVSVDGVAWRSLGLTQAVADVKLRVLNTNSFEADLSRLNYNLTLAGHSVASSSTSTTTSFKPGEAALLTVPITFSPMKLGTAALSAFQGRSASYKLTGDVALDTPFGRLSTPFDAAGSTSLTPPR